MKNNEHRINACLESLKPLKPKKYFVVDAFSTDKTVDVLRSHGDVAVEQHWCGLGKGRDLALKMALKECKDDDFLMYIGLDTIYKKLWTDLVGAKLKTLKDDEVYILGQLCNKRTNRKLPWGDLWGCEDIERLARAKSLGMRIYIDEKIKSVSSAQDRYSNELIENEPAAGQLATSRMKRYSGSSFDHFKRMTKQLSDCERAHAYRSFKDFYSISQVKSPSRKLVFGFAYVLAHLKGIYKYDNKMNNDEYVYGERPR